MAPLNIVEVVQATFPGEKESAATLLHLQGYSTT